MNAPPSLPLHDGNSIPQLGYGTFRISDDDAAAACITALEVGYRHIDTAAVYRNEDGVGRGIAAAGLPRDEVFVTTKVFPTHFEPGKVRESVSASLDRLGLDHVDLVLLHWPGLDRDARLDAWQQLEAVRDEGLTTSAGVSNHQPEHLDEIAALGGSMPAANQVELHPDFQNADVVAANDRYRIVTQSWAPLAIGEILGAQPVVDVSSALEKTPGQVVIRWHLQRGYVVIPKSERPERIAENFAVFDFELSPAQMAAIDGLEAGNRTGPHPSEFAAK